jgi:hypothetical protein
MYDVNTRDLCYFIFVALCAFFSFFGGVFLHDLVGSLWLYGTLGGDLVCMVRCLLLTTGYLWVWGLVFALSLVFGLGVAWLGSGDSGSSGVCVWHGTASSLVVCV